MTDTLSNMAVLIDADNTPISLIDEILSKAETFGQIGIKKIYGDWGSNHLKSWQSVILEHAIISVHQFAYTKGKNATDICMVIDAMDLLLGEHPYDGFCLVSSDSDFAPLAARLRAGKVKVFGFGKPSTPSSFRKACDEFICFQPPTKTESEKAAASIPDHLKAATLQIINENKEADGWTKLAIVATHLQQFDNSFSAKKYGFPKFLAFIQSIPEIALKKNGINYSCREKSEKELNDPTYIHLKCGIIPQAIKNLVFEAIAIYDDGEHDGLVKMGDVSSYIRSQIQDFSFKPYGFKRLTDFLKAIPEIEVKTGENYSLCRFKDRSMSVPKPTPVLSKEEVIEIIMQSLEKSSHKKGWVSGLDIIKNLQQIDPKFVIQSYGFQDFHTFLMELGLQYLDIPKYEQPQRKYYRKIPLTKLIEQLKKVTQRTDIDIRDADGSVLACALGKYAHFHVHYGKYGFESFPQFFSEVVEYHKRQKEKANATQS